MFGICWDNGEENCTRPAMENQMENNMENEMETGTIDF